MFTSKKVFWVASLLYGLIVLIPSLSMESELVSAETMNSTLVACVLFIMGLFLGSRVFPFGGGFCLPIDELWLRKGYLYTLVILILISLYVTVIGPTPPMVEALTNHDSFEVALLREDAVKLNQNIMFVRLYSWARDIFSPVVFILSVYILMVSKNTRMRFYGLLGILFALFIGLWSGQKATVANYIVAAAVFSAPNSTIMIKNFIKILPIIVLMVLFTFAITQPDIFISGGDVVGEFSLFLTSISNRILGVPLEVAAIYVYSVDELQIIHPFDAIPYLKFLWTPGIFSLENRIAMEFFHQGIDSGHSNSLAFSYSYVLGGYIGCFVGGFITMAALKLSMKIVKATGSVFLYTAFSALMCYMLLDLLNGNYLQYLIKTIVLSVLVLALSKIMPGSYSFKTKKYVVSH